MQAISMFYAEISTSSRSAITLRFSAIKAAENLGFRLLFLLHGSAPVCLDFIARGTAALDPPAWSLHII